MTDHTPFAASRPLPGTSPSDSDVSSHWLQGPITALDCCADTDTICFAVGNEIFHLRGCPSPTPPPHCAGDTMNACGGGGHEVWDRRRAGCVPDGVCVTALVYLARYDVILAAAAAPDTSCSGVYAFSAAGHTPVRVLTTAATRVRALRVLRDGSRCAVCMQDGGVAVVAVADGGVNLVRGPPCGLVLAMDCVSAPAPGGGGAGECDPPHHVLCAGYAGTVVEWRWSDAAPHSADAAPTRVAAHAPSAAVLALRSCVRQPAAGVWGEGYDLFVATAGDDRGAALHRSRRPLSARSAWQCVWRASGAPVARGRLFDVALVAAEEEGEEGAALYAALAGEDGGVNVVRCRLVEDGRVAASRWRHHSRPHGGHGAYRIALRRRRNGAAEHRWAVVSGGFDGVVRCARLPANGGGGGGTATCVLTAPERIRGLTVEACGGVVACSGTHLFVWRIGDAATDGAGRGADDGPASQWPSHRHDPPPAEPKAGHTDPYEETIAVGAPPQRIHWRDAVSGATGEEEGEGAAAAAAAAAWLPVAMSTVSTQTDGPSSAAAALLALKNGLLVWIPYADGAHADQPPPSAAVRVCAAVRSYGSCVMLHLGHTRPAAAGWHAVATVAHATGAVTLTCLTRRGEWAMTRVVDTAGFGPATTQIHTFAVASSGWFGHCVLTGSKDGRVRAVWCAVSSPTTGRAEVAAGRLLAEVSLFAPNDAVAAAYRLADDEDEQEEEEEEEEESAAAAVAPSLRVVVVADSTAQSVVHLQRRRGGGGGVGLSAAPGRAPRSMREASHLLAATSHVRVTRWATTVSVHRRLADPAGGGGGGWAEVARYDGCRAPRLCRAGVFAACRAPPSRSDVGGCARVVHCADGVHVVVHTCAWRQPTRGGGAAAARLWLSASESSVLYGGALVGKDYNAVAYAAPPLHAFVCGNEDSAMTVLPAAMAGGSDGALAAAAHTESLYGPHESNIHAVCAIPPPRDDDDDDESSPPRAADVGAPEWLPPPPPTRYVVTVGGLACVTVWGFDAATRWRVCGSISGVRARQATANDAPPTGTAHGAGGELPAHHHRAVPRFLSVIAPDAHTIVVGASDGVLRVFDWAETVCHASRPPSPQKSDETVGYGTCCLDMKTSALRCVAKATLRGAAAAAKPIFCLTSLGDGEEGGLMAGDSSGSVYLVAVAARGDGGGGRDICVVAQQVMERAAVNALSEAMSADPLTGARDETSPSRQSWFVVSGHDSGNVFLLRVTPSHAWLRRASGRDATTGAAAASGAVSMVVVSSFCTGMTACRGVRWVHTQPNPAREGRVCCPAEVDKSTAGHTLAHILVLSAATLTRLSLRTTRWSSSSGGSDTAPPPNLFETVELCLVCRRDVNVRGVSGMAVCRASSQSHEPVVVAVVGQGVEVLTLPSTR